MAGTAETLRMIAPGPDDRAGKLWWVFGLNRVERSDARAAFGPAGQSKSRWTKCLRVVRPERRLARNVARRSERSETRDSRDFRVRGVERSGKDEVSSDSSTGTVRREERRKTIRTEQSAKPGAVFGQHGRSEPPKPESAVRSQDVMSGSKSGDRGVGGNTGSPIAFGDGAPGQTPPMRHPGLVPGSTVPRSQRPMGVRNGGCRDEPGMTVEADPDGSEPSPTGEIHLQSPCSCGGGFL